MSGSVALCKLLQKNKRYYHRKEHFVFTSSMAYRMKHNGTSLAFICILATMVLVMIASSSRLYFDADDAIRTRFPQETQLEIHRHSLDDMANDKLAKLRSQYERVFQDYAFATGEVQDYRYAVITGMMADSRLRRMGRYCRFCQSKGRVVSGSTGTSTGIQDSIP